VVIAVILLLLPALWCSVYYALFPPTPPMGQANVEISEDSFFSTADDIDHSTEVTIRVSNFSDSGNETIEIAFFEFELTIPPAGSYLSDLVFEFNCAEVLMEGALRFHKCESVRLQSNLTFDTLPEYDPLPFTSITITQNGTYTVSLHEEGGYTDWAGYPGLFAIVADMGTQIIIHSTEAESFQPQMTLFSPVGIWINPTEYPQLWYIHPVGWVSVIAAIMVLSIGCTKLSKTRNGA
jgi:hypothetical protein